MALPNPIPRPFARAVAIAGLALIGALSLTGRPLLAQDTGGSINGPRSVAPVAEKLLDAVVNISTTQTVKGPQGIPLPEVPEGSPFEEFFKEFFDDRKGGGDAQRQVSSLGSGFVIDPAGLIVTNNHVIADADEIFINFNDGTKLKVDNVLGRDQKTDIALLKVTPAKPLTAVAFGDSSQMRVGDWVMAIGNPFGLGGTVTVGIISAVKRDINSGPYDEFLQTDAAINKGNSGGPLFSMNGEVIGINTAIISPSGGSIGIGFAVPSNTAFNIIGQLRDFGETRRGWIGVSIQSVTDEIAESLGMEQPKGALVGALTPDGPAAKGGLKTSDVILSFDGKPVPSMRELPKIVALSPIGKTVEVEVLRGGETLTLDVTIERLIEAGGVEEASATPGDEVGPEAAGSQSVLGLTLVPLTPDLRKKYAIADNVSGVLVAGADPNGPGGEKGIREGEVVSEVTNEQVATPADVVKRIDAVKTLGRTSVLLLVTTPKGEIRFVAVPVK
jgi:serine protease Do